MAGVSNLASAGINLALSHQANRRADKQTDKSRDRQIAEIREQNASNARERQALLKRRIAEIRARNGASGIATSGGSIDAVIQGLQREAKQEAAASASKANSKIDQTRDNASQKKRKNLLALTSSLTRLGSGRSFLR